LGYNSINSLIGVKGNVYGLLAGALNSTYVIESEKWPNVSIHAGKDFKVFWRKCPDQKFELIYPL